jgi:hypothetical protein
MGSTGADSGNGIATDSSGNVFVTGSYSAALTLYNTGGTTGATLTNVGGTDGFLVKYSETGTVSWAAQIAGTTTSGDTANALATDASGNAFVTGSYSAALTLYNTGGTTGATLASSGGDCFIGKYSPTGTVLWAARIPGGGGNGISTDPNGNAFIFGNYGAALTLYSAGGGSSNTLPFVGATDSFIAKYSSDGTILWAAQIANVTSGRSIATDTSGNAFVTGFYGSSPLTAYSAGGGSSNTLSFSGIYNSFLAKYSSTGSNLWLAQISGSFVAADQVATDSSGNVFVAGNYSNTLILYSAGGGSSNTLSANGYDGFLGKYSSAGIIVWSARVSGSGNDDARAVITDLNGNVFLAGYYSAATTVYNSDGTAGPTLATIAGNDCFLAKYSPTGSAIWATRFGGSGSDIAFELTTDSSGNVCVTGNYSAALTLYNMDGTTGGTLTNAGGNDVFVIKYSPAGFITSSPVPANSNVMVSTTYPSPTAMTPFTNGVSMTALAGTTLATTGLYVGGPSNYFNGSVSEVLVFNNTLGSTQRQSVEGYLARKWALQTFMPTIHPFRSLPPFTRQFSPLDIPGCQLWLDGADAAMTSNITTGIWRDKSGNGCNTTSNAGGGAFSMGTINGLPAVTFPAASISRLSVAVSIPVSSTAGFTAFFLANQAAPMTAGRRFFTLVSSDGFGLISAGRTAGLAYWYANPGGVIDVTLPVNTPFVYSATAISVSYGSLDWLNGASGGGTNAGVPAANTITSINIGNQGGAGAASNLSFTGQVGEFLVYSNVLTNSQRLQVEGYLSAKWSIPNFGMFNPLGAVPGLVAWFDTYDTSYATTGNTVTGWQNKAEGFGYTSATTGAGTVSINQAYLNGKSSVRFPAGTNYLNTTLSFSTNLRSTFYVATIGASATDTFANVILIGNDTIGGQLYGYGNQLQFNKAGTSALTTAANNYFGSTSIVSITTATGNTGIWVNGSNQTLIQNNVTSTFWNTGSSTLSIGGFAGLTTSSNADIYELLHFDGSMTTFQRQQIEGYLAWKWGLQANLPATHPFALAAPSAHPYKTLPPTTSQPAQYSEVSPGNWTHDWQPYLQQLARANSNATASFSSNSVSGTSGNYQGGVLAPNGKIYCIPSGASTVGVIDPVANTFTTPVSGSAPGGGAYAGGVLAPNGKIYCVPNAATSVGVIDPVANTFTTFGSGTGYFGGVLAPNGKIYCIPCVATSVGVIDPAASPNTFTTSVSGTVTGTGAGFYAYFGGVLAPNGKIYCIPANATTIGVIDPVTNTFTTFGTTPGGGAYIGGVLAPNGKIYCIPYVGTSVGVIDPLLNSFNNTTVSGTNTVSGGGYQGGVLGPNGKIYCISHNATTTAVIDPVANTFTTFATTSGSSAYSGGILAPNGNIYYIPHGQTSVGRISFTGLSQLPSSNYCLSAYTNKL